jgi:hypothetical protein
MSRHLENMPSKCATQARESPTSNPPKLAKLTENALISQAFWRVIDEQKIFRQPSLEKCKNLNSWCANSSRSILDQHGYFIGKKTN